MKKISIFILSVCTLACATRREQEPMSEKARIQYQFAYQSFTTSDLIPALAAGLRAAEASPNNPDIHNLLGLIYFRQEKFDQAEAEFKDAVLLDPKLSEAHLNLGTLYYQMKRYPDSRLALEKALENPLYLYPERIYNNLGLTYEALGLKKEAKAAYERSISLRDDFYLPYQNLGKMLVESDDKKRAESLLSEAAKLCTECSEPRYYLGNLLLKQNKSEEALRVFREGANRDPKGYYGQLCQKFLVRE